MYLMLFPRESEFWRLGVIEKARVEFSNLNAEPLLNRFAMTYWPRVLQAQTIFPMNDTVDARAGPIIHQLRIASDNQSGLDHASS